MEERGIRGVGSDGEELRDLAGLSLDTGIPPEERAAYVLEALGDPCRFRVGEIRVRLAFFEPPDSGGGRSPCRWSPGPWPPSGSDR